MARKRTTGGRRPKARPSRARPPKRARKRPADRPPETAPAQGTAGASQEGAGPQAVARAEELVGRMTERLGHYAGMLGSSILSLADRARKEAGDIWAEAQSIRRGEGR